MGTEAIASKKFDIYEREVASSENRSNMKIAVFGAESDSEVMKDIAVDILQVLECEVYVQTAFEEDDFVRTGPAYFSEISLFVFAVSEAFLSGNGCANKYVFEYAKNRGKILPILVDTTSGLAGKFTEKCGKFHLLRRYAGSYVHDLERYINDYVNVYINITLTPAQEKLMKELFKNRIFISYRKKDAEYLHRFIELFRTIPECYDTALFYDDALVPGENYSDRLKREISGADTVVFIVTPNLTEEGNYVIDVEYPQAVAEGKRLVPVMLCDTDEEILRGYFPGFGDLIDIRDQVLFRETFLGIRRNYGEPAPKSAEEKYFLAAAFEKGEETELNISVANLLYNLSASESYVHAMAKVAEQHYLGYLPEDYEGEKEELLWSAGSAILDELERTDPESREALAYAGALAKVSDEYYMTVAAGLDHEKTRGSVLMLFKAIKAMKTIGFLSPRYMSMPYVRLAEMYLYEGNLESAEHFFEMAEKELNALLGASNNNIYVMSQLGKLYVHKGHLLTLYILRGDSNSTADLEEARQILEKAADLVLKLIKVEDQTRSVKLVAHDLYVMACCCEKMQQTGAYAAIYSRISHLLYNSGLVDSLPTTDEIREIYHDDGMFRRDLNYSSLDELKQKLDRYSEWYVMDCREEELYSMFMFEDGFIPEGVWGDADQNFIASSYKCFRCGTRLYKAEFPEGREPVLLFGPRKDKGIIPARVFTCPKCGRFFAVPKKRKLIQGPVFMAAPILNKDNRSGRAIYDSWWEYFNYLGEI